MFASLLALGLLQRDRDGERLGRHERLVISGVDDEVLLFLWSRWSGRILRGSSYRLEEGILLLLLVLENGLPVGAEKEVRPTGDGRILEVVVLTREVLEDVAVGDVDGNHHVAEAVESVPNGISASHVVRPVVELVEDSSAVVFVRPTTETFPESQLLAASAGLAPDGLQMKSMDQEIEAAEALPLNDLLNVASREKMAVECR